MGSAARLARAATVGNGQNPTSVRLACCTRALDAVFASCGCHETDKSRELSGSQAGAALANFMQKGMRDAGDIVLFSCASDSERRLGTGARRDMPGHIGAERTTLIEIVDDVTGAGQAPV